MQGRGVLEGPANYDLSYWIAHVAEIAHQQGTIPIS